MAGFCLNPKVADDLKQKFIRGEINPETLAQMSSKDRRAVFAKHVGEANAEPVNRLFESKLILKNQQQGMITWAKQLIGLSPQAKRDLISRIERMDKVLEPHDEQAFLEDLASYRLGTRVSYEEARTISELSNKIEETREAMDKGGDRLEYGRSVVDLHEYVNDLKQQAFKVGFRESVRHPLETAVRAAKAVPGTAKAIAASMDNSAIFRQGWKTMWTHPRVWARNSLRSFGDLFGKFGPKIVMRELNAEIMSRPTYDLMQKAKLDVGNPEEAFPTSLPEKVPILGRAYKRTETAYTAFVQRTRADVFDRYLQIAEKNGVDLTTTELQSIGRLVNSLTGRGHLGRLEPIAGVTNSIFFSPKLLKANIDTLTQPWTGAGGSSFVKRQAALNLVKMTAGTATVLTIARALLPNDDAVELDPRSTDFGRIKIGNVRFDVTAGMSGLVVLLARAATAAANATTGKKIMSFKSSTSGKFKDLVNPEYGDPNLMDIFWDFFQNKFSPAMGVVRDFAKGSTMDGKKPTPTGEVLSLLTPIPAKTLTELLKDPEAQKDKRFIALAQTLDMLGVNVSVRQKRSGKPKEDITLHDLIDLAASLPEKIQDDPKP